MMPINHKLLELKYYLDLTENWEVPFMPDMVTER